MSNLPPDTIIAKSEEKQAEVIDRLYKLLYPITSVHTKDRLIDEVVLKLYEEIENAYTSGYNTGMADEAMARGFENE